jgi:hypothetical protein
MLGSVFVGAESSYANSGSMDRANSDGRGWVNFSTNGQSLSVSINASDRSCNNRGFGTDLTIKVDGGPTIHREVNATAGCNTGAGRTESFGATQLEGKRSGYMEMKLCHKITVGWWCSPVVASAYWNI